MPLIVPRSQDLPVYQALINERVPIIDQSRAQYQDIRPLRIGLLNLMPAAVRETTEIQFFRLLGNTPLQIHPILICFDQFTPKTGRERMEFFYQPWSKVKKDGLDGLIITGANLERQKNGELIKFEQIHYHKELCELIDWHMIMLPLLFILVWHLILPCIIFMELNASFGHKKY